MMTFKRDLVIGAVVCAAWSMGTAGTSPAADGTADQTSSTRPEVTVQHFQDVEPQEAPWGWLRWLMNAKVDPKAEMTFGVVYIKPHQENPMHMHPNSAEYLHVLEGSCQHLVGDQWVTLKAGDTVRIPKNVRHMARTGNEACRAVVVYNTGDRQFVPMEPAPAQD